MKDLTPTAAGIVVGSAYGDALGAGYEYGSARLPAPGTRCQMIGGGLGNFAPYEWTDDTSMATALLDGAAHWGLRLGTRDGLDTIAAGFLDWYATHPVDIGTHTRQVLRAGNAHRAHHGNTHLGAVLLKAARNVPSRAPQHVSNGAVMRTAPAVLPWLASTDPAAVAQAGTVAGRIAALTHAEPTSILTTAAWVALLWTAAQPRSSAPTSEEITVPMLTAARAALTQQQHAPTIGLDTLNALVRHVTGQQHEPWIAGWQNGSALGCIRDALAAVWPEWIADPTGSDPDRFTAAVDTAVRAGGDTDTVAAVAGGLAGAIWGLSAIPDQDHLHGYPTWTTTDLLTRSEQALTVTPAA